MNFCEKCMRPLGAEKVCPDCGTQPPAPAHHLKPGTIFNGKYLIGRAIGQGGFGITYLGRDLVLDTMVAIKEYYPNTEVTRDHNISNTVVPTAGLVPEEYSKALDRFLVEARILAKFSNEPGVVGVRDFFRDNDTAYIVMEYLDGITLKEYVRRKGPVPANVLLKLMEPVLQVLHKIHERGLIHRDISPDNLMLMKDGRLKLLDFGAARAFTDEKSLSIVLKQGYAPVEQYWNGDRQGAWTDVYAVCATIYKCLTGTTPVAAVQRAVQDELKPPSALGISITPQQEKTLMYGLAVKDTDRCRSMQELLAGFAGKTTTVPVPAPAPVPAEPVAPAPTHVPAPVPVAVPMTKPSETVPEKPVMRTLTPEEGESYAASAVERETQEKKSNVPLIVALIALVVTVLALGVWMLLGLNGGEPKEDDPADTQTEEKQEEKEPEIEVEIQEEDPPEEDDEEPIQVKILHAEIKSNTVSTLEIEFQVAAEKEPKEWIATYYADGEEPQEKSFTGHNVVLEDLEPDTLYTIELKPSEDAVLVEPVDPLEGRTQPAVTIVAGSVNLEWNEEGHALIKWESEGADPASWTIEVSGSENYSLTETVEENELLLEDLVFGESYEIVISSDNMVDAVVFSFTKDKVFVKEIEATVADDGSVTVKWQSEEVEGFTWCVVCTPEDEPEKKVTKTTEDNEITLSDLMPGKKYTITLCDKEETEQAGESSVQVETPKAKEFSLYGFQQAEATFYLCPDVDEPEEDDLGRERESFSPDESIAVAVRTTDKLERNKQSVSVVLMIKDAAGNTAGNQNVDLEWNDMWNDGTYIAILERVPEEAGTYTLEMYIGEEKVNLTGNTFKIK